MTNHKRLVFTGGHHTGALVVASVLVSQGWEIIWFGHRHSMWSDPNDSAEYQEVTSAGIPFYDLKAGKFYRTFHPIKLIRIPFGFFQAFFLLLKIKPDGIVSFGGYLAVPTVIMGWLLGIPSITHEQTVTIGWANILITKFSKKIAVSWPQSLSLFPAGKAVLTGLPVRPEILTLPKKQTSTKKIVYITGGKQGSHTINSVIFSSLPDLLIEYNVIHQTGSVDFSVAKVLIQEGYVAFSFSSEKQIQAFSDSDVVISRGGAHTVYELGLLGKKCVIIPIPWVSHQEQLLNAQILEKNHLAIILKESELSPTSLQKSIEQALILTGKPLKLPINATQNLINLITAAL